MNINTTLPNSFLADNQQHVMSQEQRQLEDAKQLLRDDLIDVVKVRILQFQISKSLSENAKQQIKTGVVVKNTNDPGTIINTHENEKHFAASVNKLAVTYLLLDDLDAGQRSMDEELILPPADQRSFGGGMYDQDDDTPRATLRDILHDMLNRSGNTAVRVLVNSMGGAAAVNDRLAHIPELPNTRLIVLPDPQRFYLGDTTAREALFVMEQLYKAPGQHARFINDALQSNIYKDFGVRSQVGDIEHIRLINKHGLLDDPDGNNRHDVGIIHNLKTGQKVSYAIMTTSPYTSQTATGRAEESIQEIGRNLLRYAGDKREENRRDIQPLKLEIHNQVTIKGKIVY